jgi:hypothetical protein
VEDSGARKLNVIALVSHVIMRIIALIITGNVIGDANEQVRLEERTLYGRR